MSVDFTYKTKEPVPSLQFNYFGIHLIKKIKELDSRGFQQANHLTTVYGTVQKSSLYDSFVS